MNHSKADNNALPETCRLFSALTLNHALLENLASLQFEQMTPIQALSLPQMLKGQDVIAQAKTGSGKTAAFGLSLLNQLKPNDYSIQGLVLCPTRELAEQVSQALRRLARCLPNVKILNLSGGMPMRPQQDSLRHGAHVIVGTPWRVQKHLDKETLSLRKVQTVVLDEADRMLDMGFFDAIERVLLFCPGKRQTVLFSATYPAQIKQLASDFMTNPTHVVADDSEQAIDIEQCFYEVARAQDKLETLVALLKKHPSESTLIFCNTKEQTKSLAQSLNEQGFSASALNGDMEQIDRDLTMIRFVNQSCSILVATDVAARGLDIQALPLVINYDVAFEVDTHTHRIGRTGRAGNKGLALSISLPNEAERLCQIETSMTSAMTWGDTKRLSDIKDDIQPPRMVTMSIAAGKKDKIRPGDVLGALTKDAGLPADSIGKINITPLYSYVAIDISHADKAYQYFKQGKLKGRAVNVRRVG